MSRKSLKLATLVEDYEVYPRSKVDEFHVTDLFRALQAGAELPPIIIDAKSKRIVDGFHRVRAYRRHLGEAASVTAEVRDYGSEAELFADAARLNAGHGRRLERIDHVRVVLRARELGIADEEISAILAVPVERVSVLAVRVATTQAGDRVPVKHGAEHLAGRTLTDAQLAAMRQMRGSNATRLARELARLIESGVADLDDPQVLEELVRLADVIRVAVKGRPVEEVEPAAAAV